MRPTRFLALVFLTAAHGAYGQTVTKPQTTNFLHQTLGESWATFMDISGSKMNPCASQAPQATEWCAAFKKIDSGQDGEFSSGNGTVTATLYFSNKTLMKVEARGRADFFKTVEDLGKLNGPADSRTDTRAVWNFADGGEIKASAKPNDEVEVLFYSKLAKDSAEPLVVASTNPSSAPARARTDFRGFTLGASIDDIIKEGRLDESVCVKLNKDTKAACKQLDQIKGGKIVGLELIRDKSGSVRLIFEGRKLVEIEVRPTVTSSFDEQLTSLTEKFGAPSSSGTHTEANAMGARWECSDAIWQMPDGSVISAYEFIEVLDYVGPTRVVVVDLKGPDRVQKDRTDQQAQTMKY